MSVQTIYDRYLSHLTPEERQELIRLLAGETETSAEQKLQIANRLRAEATQEQWAALSGQLPDVPELTLEEIVEEVKRFRKTRKKAS